MKSQLIAISLMSLFAGSAMAQSAFSGFYGQVSTGYESNQLGSLSADGKQTPSGAGDVRGSGSSQTFGGAPLILGVGYYWAANEKWLIGVGADYSALSQTSSSFPVNGTNGPGGTTIPAGATAISNGTSMQLSNRFNIFVTPAYAIDKDKLVYIKAGYSQVSAQYNRPTSSTLTNGGASTTVAGTGGSQSSNQKGYLIGLGYKQIITSGLYGFVEGNYMGYDTINDNYNSVRSGSASVRTNNSSFSSLNGYQFLVGLGYAF